VRTILVRTGEGASAEASGAEFVARDFSKAADIILGRG
jgi:hypothetical protein